MIEATGTNVSETAEVIPSLAPREDFPILQREIHGKPLVFLDSAASAQKPVQVLEAMDSLRAHELRQRPSRRLHAQRRGHRAHGAGAQAGRAFHQRPLRPRGHLHAQHQRGDQPRRLLLGERQPARGRRHPQHRDGASQQHRAVATARPARRRARRVHPHHRRRRTGPGRLHAPAGDNETEAGRANTDVECAGNAAAGRAHHRAGARGWRAGPAGRRAERAASAGGRARAGLRLPRLQRAQDAGAERDRRPLGAA